MTLNPIRANMTELRIDCMVILFSYKTPVAAQTPEGLFRTARRWSNTTTRHINQWLDDGYAQEKPQEFFDSLIAKVK